MTMRHIGFCVAALAVVTGMTTGVFAQARVAPPTPVQSAPLAPPATLPPVEPQPVQPPPAPPAPLTPQPVQPAPVPQVPLEPQPVQPPPSLPALAQPLSAPPAQQQTALPNPNATLAGRPGDSSDVDAVELVSKPVLIVAGQSSWDQGFERLTASFRILREEAAKAGLLVAGRPLSLFVETDDNGFKFEAMLPVAIGAAGTPPGGFGRGVMAGTSPAGPSLRFVHVAPYDDIDSTYETITAYLEAKNIVVKDLFIEEYVGDLSDPADPALEINVYVQPR